MLTMKMLNLPTAPLDTRPVRPAMSGDRERPALLPKLLDLAYEDRHSNQTRV